MIFIGRVGVELLCQIISGHSVHVEVLPHFLSACFLEREDRGRREARERNGDGDEQHAGGDSSKSISGRVPVYSL